MCKISAEGIVVTITIVDWSGRVNISLLTFEHECFIFVADGKCCLGRDHFNTYHLYWRWEAFFARKIAVLEYCENLQSFVDTSICVPLFPPDSGQQARLPAKHDPDVAAGQKRLSVPEMGEYSENESDELSQFLRLVWSKLVSDVWQCLAMHVAHCM